MEDLEQSKKVQKGFECKTFHTQKNNNFFFSVRGFLGLLIVLFQFPMLYLPINISDLSFESKAFIVALRSHKSNMSTFLQAFNGK